MQPIGAKLGHYSLHHIIADITIQRNAIVLLDGLGSVDPASKDHGRSAERAGALVIVHATLHQLAKLGEQFLEWE